MNVLILAKNALKEFSEDDCSTIAQAIAYSAFFSLFPLLLGAIAILGFVIEDPTKRDEVMNAIYTNLPASGSFVSETLSGVMENKGQVGFIAALLLLISGRGVFLAVVHGLNLAFEAPAERGFIGNIILALLLLFGVGSLMVASLVVTALIQALASYSILGFGPYTDTILLTPIQFLVTFAVSTGMFFLLYRWGPNVDLPWRDILPGAVVAAFLFEAAKLLFVFYVKAFLKPEDVYGTIGSVVALLTWCYFSSMILLLGAEVASEYHKLREAAAAPAEKPVVRRPGPVMVPPAQVPMAQRVMAVIGTIAASAAAVVAVWRTRRPSF